MTRKTIREHVVNDFEQQVESLMTWVMPSRINEALDHACNFILMTSKIESALYYMTTVNIIYWKYFPKFVLRDTR